MTAFKTFTVYCGIKTHFGKLQFDYAKYNSKIKINPDAFLKRTDKYYFEKLSKNIKESDLRNYLIANFLENPNIWIGDLLEQDATDIYNKWKQRYESIQYNFENEIQHIENLNEYLKPSEEGLPKIINLLLENKISPETFSILDKIFNLGAIYVKYYKKDAVLFSIILKYIKYTKIIKIEQELKTYKNILKKELIKVK